MGAQRNGERKECSGGSPQPAGGYKKTLVYDRSHAENIFFCCIFWMLDKGILKPISVPGYTK
jgi:hypothetical protein